MHEPSRTTLHLIRHADAMPAADAELSADTGGYDMMGLSVKGAIQAEALARRLARTTRLAAIYASPTRRAFDTAGVIARATGLAVVPDFRLREIYLGDESVAAIAPEDRARTVRARLTMFKDIALRDGTWSNLPDVEPAAEVRERVTEAVEEITARHPGEHVAIVSHAGSINSYLAALLGVPRDFFFPIGNTALNSVRISEGRALLLRLNDAAHLEK